MNSIAQGASAPTSAPAELSNEISISIKTFGACGGAEFIGSRAQIEAEGLVPPSIAWPASGFKQVTWDDGFVMYQLCRRRPCGAKGPRRDFESVDHWSLRTVLLYAHWATREIAIKEAELQAVAHRYSPQGRAEISADVRAWSAAADDGRFPSFRAKMHGVTQPVRASRARQSKGVAE